MKKLYTICFSFFLFVFALSTNCFAFPASSSTIYNGIDVSEWQGYIDYSEVKQNNIDVVYIKSSEGTRYIDPYFRENYQNAKANGLKVGFYHFLTATSEQEAIDQANFFVSVVKGTSTDCRLAMDFEVFNGLNNEEINIISKAFLQEVERLSGKKTVIYSNASNARNVFSEELASQYPVWVAEYGPSEPANGNWSSWVGFQYTNQGEVAGINGYVDRDYFTNDILLSENSEITKETTTDVSQNTDYVIVKYGDTLSRIAESYHTSYLYLAKINNISNPNLIYVGQKIYFPTLESSDIHDTNHILYVVKRGNTLTYISRLYGVSIDSIVRLNHIANPNLIYTGEVLRIN